jgi:hypothetical protein
MTDDSAASDTDAQLVAEATAFLESRGVPAGAREFRLRQEFFRHGWDMRVREENGVWTVRATKRDRPDVELQGSSEGDSLRMALAAALTHDAT